MNYVLDPAVLEWLRVDTGGDRRQVPTSWVPGATAPELRALFRLGALVRPLLSKSRELLPPDVSGWLDMSEKLTIPPPVGRAVLDGFHADPDSALADIYGTLVAAANRRPLGTFFTPMAEANRLLEMWDATMPEPRHVVDVGAGVGVFTAAAADRWRDASVSAIDVNPITLGLLAVRLFAGDQRTAKRYGRQVDLVLDDYTSWLQTPGLPQTSGRLILGNPPYTRAQLMSPARRQELVTLTRGLCGARASLSTIITAQTLLALEETDGILFLLPAQWLEADYARKLRARLWSSSRRHVELHLVESQLFQDAIVDAVALLVGPMERSPGFFTSSWSGTGSSGSTHIDPEGPMPAGWRSLFAAPGSQADQFIAPEPTARALSDFAVVRRGVATGANTFFVLSQAKVASNGLPVKALQPVLTRLIGIAGSEVIRDEDIRNCLLRVSRKDVERNTNLARYVEFGVSQTYDRRVLCSQRKDWFDLNHDLKIPDIVMASMGRTGFRVLENRARAAITNNLYGLTWRKDVGVDTQKSIVDWLRCPDGQAAIRRVARTQGRGLLKVEPRAVSNIPIPAEVTDQLVETTRIEATNHRRTRDKPGFF